MEHVSDRLGRWLGGELDAAAQAAVEAHLAGCAACRREADDLRAVWLALAASAPPAPAGSVWPAVRARTGAGRRGWFFADRPLAQASLAAAAVACGLLAAVLLPAGGEAVAADSTQWATSSRALDDEAAGALDVWLDPGAAEAEVAR